MRLQRENVHPIQQPVQFATREFHDFACMISRPRKSILLEFLLPKHEAVALPKQKLHVIALPVAKGEELTAKRIEIERFFNQGRKAQNLFAKVDDVEAKMHA